MQNEGRLIHLESGMILGERYTLVGKLGSGGMGDVYAAEDLKLQGKLRAIKVTDSDRASEEARMLMRLSHPNLPHIMDSFTLTGYGAEAIVMDYIHGVTLGELFNRHNRQLSFGEAIKLALPICSALVYLHSQFPPIIHRDLKPSNIMVENNGHVRLIDFGIAKSRTALQTQTTMKLGTPGFAAPEQHMGRSETRTDIYGFGALLYYLLSEGSYLNHAEMMNRSNRFIRGLRTDVPSRFADLLWRMVQPRIEDRYNTMVEVERELHACAGIAANRDIPVRFAGTSKLVQGGNPEDCRTMKIAVVPVSSGAGATFVAITLAKLLANGGIPCAAAEFPSERPEWAALLRSNMRGRDQLEDRYYSWNEQGVWWHAQKHPVTQDYRDELDKLQLRLRAKEIAVSVTDVSVGALIHHKEWLLQSELVLVVADPYPSRWKADQILELEQISRKLEARGASLKWIANKDAKFSGRNEWIGMMPELPIAAVPLLPATDWLDAIWHGKWATDIKAMGKPLEKAFKPLLDFISHEMQRNAAHVRF
ncbi:serine/threonine-protein kinase [Paenibacillus sp. JDR-2]|uniref:serine/threonine-protein kinase n=1 Tax=Paenibacillus sp. (strain JDR-2) TaxID=324057 RepID=UPI00016656D7|nr:serine/threonine-protein kinase [Paenibacillus sp. JDR-2]ACT01291.1 serine/threonine protein kinase [Paenibacillus sp. JDR-2]